MEKIKQFLESGKGKDIIIIFIVISVGFGAFELGRLSKTGNSSGIKIEYNGQTETASVISALKTSNLLAAPTTASKSAPSGTMSQPTGSKNFFASIRGTKYYPTGCTAGNTLKQENRIYFETREEAEKAGYVLSSSCR